MDGTVKNCAQNIHIFSQLKIENNYKNHKNNSDDLKYVQQLERLSINNQEENSKRDSVKKQIIEKKVNYFNLNCLNLSKCNIKVIPDEVSMLINLVTLNLSHNYLKTLPYDCKRLNKLRHLNLSHNMISVTPQCLSVGLVILKTLNLSSNIIYNFNVHESSLKLLKVLNLRNNNLVCFPNWLLKSNDLSIEELDLSKNCAIFEKSLSNEIIFDVKLKKQSFGKTLKVLKLSNCSLNKQNINVLFTFSNLCKLYLSNELKPVVGRINLNVLMNLPVYHLSSVKNITALYLSNVSLNDIKYNVKLFINLRILDVSYNNLMFIPYEICLLENLQELIMTNNQLTSLPTDFGKLNSLRRLYLSTNKLCGLPDSFKYLNCLELLDLYDNCFESMPDVLYYLNLKALDLGFNYFNPKLFSEKNDQIKNCCMKRINGFNYTQMRDEFIKIDPNASFRCDYEHPISDYDDDDDEDEDGKYFRMSSDEDHMYDSDEDESRDTPESFKNLTVEINEEDGKQKLLEQSEENWDIEYDADNYFDPNALGNDYYQRVVVPYDFENNFFWHNNQDEHSYCPGEFHPKSIRAKIPRHIFGDSVEGQFDDA